MTVIDIDATGADFITCPRCRAVSAVQSGPVVCSPCGLTVGEAPIFIEVATRVELLDALAAADLDQIVRLVLAAHADGLVAVAR